MGVGTRAGRDTRTVGTRAGRDRLQAPGARGPRGPRSPSGRTDTERWGREQLFHVNQTASHGCFRSRASTRSHRGSVGLTCDAGDGGVLAEQVTAGERVCWTYLDTDERTCDASAQRRRRTERATSGTASTTQ